MGKASRLSKPKFLGGKLAEIRRQLQLSQNGMIRKLGFTTELVREEISAFERGVRVPQVIALLEYARVANVAVEVLIDDELDLPEKLPADPKSDGIKRQKSIRSRMK
jgi:transcriptional regulator with XRE-family HTH domain